MRQDLAPEEAPSRASEFLASHLDGLLQAARLGPVLDLACGDGRNGLALAMAAASMGAPGPDGGPDRSGHGGASPVGASGMAPDGTGTGSRERLFPSSEQRPALQAVTGPDRIPAHVLLVDKDPLALESLAALGHPANVRFERMDLESDPPPDFGLERFGAVLVFRYLHRPLIAGLRRCLVPGGTLLYETFLTGQEVYGRPRNPEHLLRPGELAAWFGDWEVLELFEGFLADPPRVMGRLACRKPRVASQPGP